MSDTTEILALTADEKRILARLLRHAIDSDRYPLSPRLTPLRRLLAKLEPPAPPYEPPPPLKPGMGPSHGQGRRRWRG